MIREILMLGQKMYNTKNWRERHRLLTYRVRVLLYAGKLGALYRFFADNPARKAILETNPFPIEQATRAFFFAGSSCAVRAKLIREHVMLLEKKFPQNEVTKLVRFDRRYEIWRSKDEGSVWKAILTFEPGQRKEGMLSVMMLLGDEALYQIIFWLGYDAAGEESLFIGAMQGPNMAHAREIVKEATKRAHRYRTKNLILYMTQAVARALALKHIYAVSNEGYYANNHVRRDRKLKTDFGVFWEEAGGHVTKDARFYELPLTESRKTMEEVPTRKRAVYRRRFAFQDDVDVQIAAAMEKLRRK